MHRILPFGAILILPVLCCFPAPPAPAASFDCSKAHAAAEIAICRHRELSELDTEMGALWFTYRQLPFLMGMSGVRRDEANAFLRKRAACGARVPCLRKLYRARVKALRQGITAALDDMRRALQN